MKQEAKKEIMELWKQIFFHNLFTKILSIVGAVLVWIVIMNIDDPYKTKGFIVSVETINEEALHSVNKVYEVTEGSTASVSVRGKRSVVDNLEAGDISATADLSELSDVNAVAIRVRLKKKVSSEVVLECNQVLKVSLEDMETKQVKVTVDTNGIPAEGYSVGECVARPNVIEVTGGGSVIDRISSVRVKLNVNGASQNFSKMLEPAAYDKRGNRVISSTLSFGKTQVKVKAQLLQNKTIPVKAEIIGKPAKGYKVIGVDCLPEEIEIAGAERLLANVSELLIPVDVSGLTNVSSLLQREVEVRSYLSDKITIPEEYQKISVKITIEKLIRKKIQIKAGDIKLRNVDRKCVAEAYDSAKVLEITVEGRESEVDDLSENDLTAFVDCDALSVGIHKLKIQLKQNESYKMIKGDSVRIVIREKEGQEQQDFTTLPPEKTAEPTVEPAEPKETEVPSTEPKEED